MASKELDGRSGQTSITVITGPNPGARPCRPPPARSRGGDLETTAPMRLCVRACAVAYVARAARGVRGARRGVRGRSRTQQLGPRRHVGAEGTAERRLKRRERSGCGSDLGW